MNKVYLPQDCGGWIEPQEIKEKFPFEDENGRYYIDTLTLSKRWLNYFKESMDKNALMSKDENTKVGAIIFSEEDGVEVSSGWNDLPRGVLHTKERNSRPLKYKLTIHSEANAIINAARMGRSTKGMSLMVSMYPCSICAGMIINAGLKKVYTPYPDFSHEKYGEDFKLSEQIFKEAKVEVIWQRKL